MEHTSVIQKQNKRGPAPRGYINKHVLIRPEMYVWDAEQDDSFSAYVRRLIREDQRRRDAITA